MGQVVEELEAQGAICPDWRLVHGEFLLVKGTWRCVQSPMSSRRIPGGMTSYGWGSWSAWGCILGKGGSSREIGGLGALGTEVGDWGCGVVPLNEFLSPLVCVL